MKELKELKEISNEVIKESEELLDYLENDLELEQIRQELVELKEKRILANKIMFAMSTMTALYTLMMIVKVIIVAIG